MAKYKKRADGRYCTQVYIGKTPEGKKQYKSIYAATPTELQHKEAELRSKLEKGINVMTLKDSFLDWRNRLKSVKELELEPSELKLWLHRTDPFIKAFGTLPLKDITQTDVQPVITALSKRNPSTGKPTAKRTIARYLAACSQVFEYAIENRATEYNPCRYVRIPKDAPVKERRALTEEERLRIEEFPHRAQPAAMLLLYSGLRRGEATALLWSDVDFINNTISVTKSYDFKEFRIKEPKTKNSVRVVSIPQKLSSFLSTLPHNSPYVLTTASGKMMTDTAWKRLWSSYLCDLNLAYGTHFESRNKFDPRGHIFTIEPFTPHCLRHTFCTLMYYAGVDVLTCQKQMGHADVKTTLSIYTHLDAQHKKQNVACLDHYLSQNAVSF